MAETHINPVDVLVVGSGAAGLCAALTAAGQGASVLVIEKAALFGGTSALSGGGVWMPASSAQARAGIVDSREAARRYLRNLLGNRHTEAVVEAYLEAGPAALDFLEREAGLTLLPSGGTDYEPHLDGAAMSRCLLTPDYDGRLMGRWLKRLRPPLRTMGGPLGIQVGFGDIAAFTNFHRSLTALGATARRSVRHLHDLLRHGRATRLTNGNALTARLLMACVNKGVTLRTRTALVELARRNGRIASAVLAIDGRHVTVNISCGAVIASGGFGASRELRERHFPQPDAGACLQPETNVGDGLAAMAALGAQVAIGNISAAIHAPLSFSDKGAFPHLMFDRLMPHTLVVDRYARRFVNESTHYQAFGTAMAAAGVDRAWLILDHRGLRRYGAGLVRPFPWPIGKMLRSGYLKRAGTPEALAASLGLDPFHLRETIDRFNSAAVHGTDPDFKRGDSAYDRSMGDPHSDHPNLAPLRSAPFYAVELRPGQLSSLTGIVCDERARVLDKDGLAIAGLFAAGVDMNSPWGGHYPGGGASLGPALTFGYIAGHGVTAG